MPCGLAPRNGMNLWLALFASNVTFPFASAWIGAGENPLSQLIVGSQPVVVVATPSHCSTNTCWPGVKPDAEIVIAARPCDGWFACLYCATSGEPGVLGTTSPNICWSVVESLLFDETRTWQFLKSGRPSDPASGGSSRPRQLKLPCGLAPLNGTNLWFAEVASK